jgi:hypothetical protein
MVTELPAYPSAAMLLQLHAPWAWPVQEQQDTLIRKMAEIFHNHMINEITNITVWCLTSITLPVQHMINSAIVYALGNTVTVCFIYACKLACKVIAVSAGHAIDVLNVAHFCT